MRVCVHEVACTSVYVCVCVCPYVLLYVVALSDYYYYDYRVVLFMLCVLLDSFYVVSIMMCACAILICIGCFCQMVPCDRFAFLTSSALIRGFRVLISTVGTVINLVLHCRNTHRWPDRYFLRSFPGLDVDDHFQVLILTTWLVIIKHQCWPHIDASVP